VLIEDEIVGLVALLTVEPKVNVDVVLGGCWSKLFKLVSLGLFVVLVVVGVFDNKLGLPAEILKPNELWFGLSESDELKVPKGLLV